MRLESASEWEKSINVRPWYHNYNHIVVVFRMNTGLQRSLENYSFPTKEFAEGRGGAHFPQPSIEGDTQRSLEEGRLTEHKKAHPI